MGACRDARLRGWILHGENFMVKALGGTPQIVATSIAGV
jgi:hypothetical protein